LIKVQRKIKKLTASPISALPAPFIDGVCLHGVGDGVRLFGASALRAADGRKRPRPRCTAHRLLRAHPAPFRRRPDNLPSPRAASPHSPFLRASVSDFQQRAGRIPCPASVKTP